MMLFSEVCRGQRAGRVVDKPNYIGLAITCDSEGRCHIWDGAEACVNRRNGTYYSKAHVRIGLSFILHDHSGGHVLTYDQQPSFIRPRQFHHSLGISFRDSVSVQNIEANFDVAVDASGRFTQQSWSAFFMLSAQCSKSLTDAEEQ